VTIDKKLLQAFEKFEALRRETSDDFVRDRVLRHAKLHFFFSMVLGIRLSWLGVKRQGAAGDTLLNKETRNAGEKPVHGFMDSLLKRSGPDLICQSATGDIT